MHHYTLRGGAGEKGEEREGEDRESTKGSPEDTEWEVPAEAEMFAPGAAKQARENRICIMY